jgi:hypothetical protein
MAISPRNDFKVYRSCPEIRSHIRRVYGWFILRFIVTLPLFAVMFTMNLVEFILDMTLRVVDFLEETAAVLADRIAEPLWVKETLALREAHEVLPLSEIQERTPDLYLPRGRVSDPSGDDILKGINRDGV